MRHGYTNDTRCAGGLVVKRYAGPDGAARAATEHRALTAVRGRVPVPGVVSAGPGLLRLEQVEGVHGQDLIDAGHAAAVLRSCGAMLRCIQETAAPRPGSVLVHGDYGPHNMLFDPATSAVTAVLDWEWAHPGEPVEDLAWCEWIVRTHHPGRTGALASLFEGYGSRPGWPVRRDAMVAKCRWMLERLRPADAPGALRWQRHLDATLAWSE
jgi:hypothetical protein